MPRKESEVVPGGNGPFLMLGGVTLEDFRQAVSEMWVKFLENIRSI